MNWVAVGYGVGLLLVGVGLAVGLGALATWATAGVRDGQDSEPPRSGRKTASDRFSRFRRPGRP